MTNSSVGIDSKDYAKAEAELKGSADHSDTRMIYNNIPTATIKELSADLERIRKLLPKTGRLNMRLIPSKAKTEIEAFVKKILANNVDCNREFQKYISCAVELSKFYSDKPELHEKAAKTAHDDMTKRLSNVILKSIKKLNQLERENSSAIRQEIYRRQVMESLITEIFSVLARSASGENNKVQYAHKYGELSKQAKIELAKKYESDTGYDWER